MRMASYYINRERYSKRVALELNRKKVVTVSRATDDTLVITPVRNNFHSPLANLTFLWLDITAD